MALARPDRVTFVWFLRIGIWNFIGAWCLAFGAFFRRGRVERSAYAVVMRAGDRGGADLRRLGKAIPAMAAKFETDADSGGRSGATSTTHTTGLDARSESPHRARYSATGNRACASFTDNGLVAIRP